VAYLLPPNTPFTGTFGAVQYSWWLVIPFILTSWSPSAGACDGEPIYVKLCRVRGHQAREALTSLVNEQISVRTIIPAQADVRARSLWVGGIHLD